MEQFLKEAEVCLAEIESDLQEMQAVSDSVAEYFCEDPNKFKLEECCSTFHSFCAKFMRAMQENKSREVAEVQRRHRDRLQCAAKRRSTATCSSRDKELDGVALESILVQTSLSKRVSRRRSGRPTSTHGSPSRGSPINGSLSEIISQANLLADDQKKGGLLRVPDVGRKEWLSAVELTENSSQNQIQPIGEDNKEKSGIPHEEEMKTSRKEDSKSFTHPANRTTTNSSSGRTLSATTEDEEDLQDNNEEEAQKLREASRKVLRFQNSRGSVSSGEYSLENLKSPGPRTKLLRQRTVDEDADRYPGDPTNEDLVRFLFNTEPSSIRDLGRRHTLPSKVLKTEGNEDNVSALHPVRSPKSAKMEKETLTTEGAGNNSTKQVFDFIDQSHDFEKSGEQDQNPPSVAMKSETNVSVAHVPGEGQGEKCQEGKSMEPKDNHVQKSSENVPPKSTWIKTETTGLFFSFFKRLGDMSKQTNSKETVQNCTDSSV
ncbi:uncharacterized protein [Labrus bergylta]|uniref:uncharacterized protein isoform X1 n=1 Tax=Labrus bergylta TaxID=56723 RepID=UPI0033136230